MTYITEEDYKTHIRDKRLEQLIDDDPTLLDEAEGTALAVVSDALYSRYDVDAIFALEGEERHKQVVRWVLVLALYYLHERLPDRLIPERIVKNHDDTLKVLTDIEDGKKSTLLPLLAAPEGYGQTSKFRWGSKRAKSHDFFRDQQNNDV
jgi:phage gp36-like protein